MPLLAVGAITYGWGALEALAAGRLVWMLVFGTGAVAFAAAVW